MYYSPTGWISWYYARFIKHPSHIFWWVKLYWSYFRDFHLAEAKASEDVPSRSIISWLRNFKILAIAVYKKVY